ncbi:hypothetical protein [Burkholderia anthina]|uniref:hypothetical protein n=1 Tax=Burkholderia anthina TaxID=179879 RepID=UPI00292E3F24|nr:hypothetical protein [Burkholderia anthina]WJN72109.1 hypothetical protein OH687_38925 [Burkholderia anthina]
MAASEVAAAASEVATIVAHTMATSEAARGATQAPVTGSNPAWFAIIGTVCGALIAAGTAMLTQHLGWTREQAKLAEQRAPAQLEVALMLEAFAKQAVGYLDACEAHIIDWLAVLEGEAPHEQRPWTPLAFDVSLVKDWSAVPIGIVSQCRELPLALAESEAWVHAVAKEEWVDIDDAYRLDGQRAIFYGLLACDLANQIRDMINVPASTLSSDTFERLQGELEKLKRIYVRSNGNIDLIPDLKTRLQRELPQALSEPGPALAAERR